MTKKDSIVADALAEQVEKANSIKENISTKLSIIEESIKVKKESLNKLLDEKAAADAAATSSLKTAALKHEEDVESIKKALLAKQRAEEEARIAETAAKKATEDKEKFDALLAQKALAEKKISSAAEALDSVQAEIKQAGALAAQEATKEETITAEVDAVAEKIEQETDALHKSIVDQQDYLKTAAVQKSEKTALINELNHKLKIASSAEVKSENNEKKAEMTAAKIESKSEAAALEVANAAKEAVEEANAIKASAVSIISQIDADESNQVKVEADTESSSETESSSKSSSESGSSESSEGDKIAAGEKTAVSNAGQADSESSNEVSAKSSIESTSTAHAEDTHDRVNAHSSICPGYFIKGKSPPPREGCGYIAADDMAFLKKGQKTKIITVCTSFGHKVFLGEGSLTEFGLIEDKKSTISSVDANVGSTFELFQGNKFNGYSSKWAKANGDKGESPTIAKDILKDKIYGGLDSKDYPGKKTKANDNVYSIIFSTNSTETVSPTCAH